MKVQQLYCRNYTNKKRNVNLDSFNNPKFNKLQRKWDRILASEGMYPEPIHSESFKATDRITSDIQMETRQIQRVGIQEYYRLAGQFLYDYENFTPLSKAIWETRCEGLSPYNTSFERFKKRVEVLLGFTGPKSSGLTKKPIRNIIKKLEVEMKRMYGITRG
jgi:hypothetical protein